MGESIELIDLDKITPSRGNRAIGGFDQAKLENLAASIKAVGVQQPAVVRVMGDGYELVAGERRWRASRLAGLTFLPCVIRELDDAQLLKIQVIENLQREDVHPLDEADGYERLRTEGGYDPELIAQEVGKSLSYVYLRLRLQKLCDEARSMLLENRINTAVATQIARLDPEQQKIVVEKFLTDWRINQGFTASMVEGFIQEEIMHDLSKARWTLKDETLILEAGSCLTCPKRTGANPELFDDLNLKKDKCLDGECFSKKTQALIERRRKELKGSDHLIVADSWTRGNVADAIEPYKWEKCKKTDEGALRVLVVAGDNPGLLTYGKIKDAYKKQNDLSSDDKQARARERKLDKAREDFLGSLYYKLKRSADFVIENGDYDQIIRFAVKKIWYNTSHDSQVRTAAREGWEKPTAEESFGDVSTKKINAMDTSGLLKFLAAIALAPESKPMACSQSVLPETYNEAASILNVDLESFTTEFVEESDFSKTELLKEPDDDFESDDDEEETE